MSDRPPTDPAVAAARGPEVRRPEAGAAVAADGSAGGEGAAGPAAFAAEPSRRALAPLVAVVLLLQLVAVAGLVAGSRTLYLRDVLTTHLPMKLAQAAAWERRELPLLDPARGGGQPSLGNPNGVPLYPDNLLYLAAPDAWAFGAHFWLHFLLAPWGAAWLARRLGCGGPAAWAGGVAYALGGFFLSQLSYYNLVAGAALAPAFAAACLASWQGSRRAGAAAGALWALLLVAGDPTVAALALLAAAIAIGASARRRREGETRGAAPAAVLETAAPTAAPGEAALAAEARAMRPAATRDRRAGPAATLLRLALALALGSLVALPQIVELARVLPTSVRGVRGYGEEERTYGSWDPRQAVELVVPLAFGRVDRLGPGGFWGHRFHTGSLPFFLTLSPGLLVLALAAAGGRARRHGGGAGWTLVAAGVFLSLGRFNPLLAPLLALPGAGLLRFPVKAWLLVAVGSAILAAAGWDRALGRGEARPRRRLAGALTVLGVGLAVAALAATVGAQRLAVWLAQAAPAGAPPELVAGEPARLAATCAAAALVAGLLLAGVRVAARRPLAGGALLLGVHVTAQLLFLAPAAMPTVESGILAAEHPFATVLPPGARVAHGSVARLFGVAPLGTPPEPSASWLARQGAAAGLPFVGVPAGWRYELASSPEGLDGYLTRLAADAVRTLPDAARVRLLRLWGVEGLVLERPLAADAGGAVRVGRFRGPLAEVHLYRLRRAAPPVRRVHGARHAADPRAALGALLDPRFDPATEVVLGGTGDAGRPGSGEVRVLAAGDERLVVATRGAHSGWLVVERAWQPQWRAEVDGRAAAVVPANLHRLAVALPAGAQRVHLWVDRGALAQTALAAAGGALGLLLLAAAGGRERSGHRW